MNVVKTFVIVILQDILVISLEAARQVSKYQLF
jgi:hypothetical protein